MNILFTTYFRSITQSISLEFDDKSSGTLSFSSPCLNVFRVSLSKNNLEECLKIMLEFHFADFNKFDIIVDSVISESMTYADTSSKSINEYCSIKEFSEDSSDKLIELFNTMRKTLKKVNIFGDGVEPIYIDEENEFQPVVNYSYFQVWDKLNDYLDNISLDLPEVTRDFN